MGESTIRTPPVSQEPLSSIGTEIINTKTNLFLITPMKEKMGSKPLDEYKTYLYKTYLYKKLFKRSRFFV
jgi:hypothetical protein